GMAVGERALLATLGQTTITPRCPAEHKSGDIGIMICETYHSDADATLTNAQGFTEFSVSPVKSLAFGSYNRLHAYWCRATSSNMTSPTITTNNDGGSARIFTFRNCISAGDPTD